MLASALATLDQHLEALAYVTLVVVLVVTTITADRRYTSERNRNVALERRVRSLTLVVRFQDSVIDAHDTAAKTTPLVTPEVVDLSVDQMILRLRYCLTCHKLKAPAHFTETGHLQLEDDKLLDPTERQ